MVGLLLGYLFVSPLSARFGHKRMIIACTAAFGAATFLTITATQYPDADRLPLSDRHRRWRRHAERSCADRRIFSRAAAFDLDHAHLYRLLAGPDRRRRGVADCCWSPSAGSAVLAFGGIGTIVLSVLFAFALPESLEYLINRGNGASARDNDSAHGLCRRFAISPATRLIAGQHGARKVRVGATGGKRPGIGTALIWAGMFMNLMIYFFLQKWLTSLLVQSGLPQQVAITATTVGLAGGIVAALIIGPLMDRYGPYAVVAGLFGLSAISVLLMAKILASPVAWVTIAVSLFVGFCLSGGQKANNALSVYFLSDGVARHRALAGRWASAGLAACSGHSWRACCWPMAGRPPDCSMRHRVPMVLGMVAIAAMGVLYTRTPRIAAEQSIVQS